MADWSRRLVQENRLSAADLIWPVFVIDGEKEARPISGLPGVSRLTIDLLIEQAKRAVDLGVPALHCFRPSIPLASPTMRWKPGTRML